jgi:ankyrin repeat protein
MVPTMKTISTVKQLNAETPRTLRRGSFLGVRREAERHAAFARITRITTSPRPVRTKAVSPLRSATAVQIFASWLLSALALMPLGGGAATNDLSSTLQQGLFEEEANRNLDAAAQAYQSVSAQFDKDRALAATAIFRLGEIYRKQNKTNEAVGQYERIVREFPDQDTLVTLSRQNLAGLLGSPKAMPSQLTTPSLSDSVTPESMRIELALLKAQLDLGRKETNVVRVMHLFSISPSDFNSFGGANNQEKLQELLIYQELRVRTLESAIAQGRDEIGTNATEGSASMLRTGDEEKEIRRILDMIKNSPDLINAKGADGETPLASAAARGQLKVVQFLLDNGADLKGQPRALNLAAFNGHKAVVELLLDRGADVNAKDKDGDTGLFRATERGFVSVAESLLTHKANVNLGNNEGRTPLHVASEAGHSAMLEQLLRNGPHLNATNYQGETPLMQAAGNGHLEAVKALLAANADVNLQSTAGHTALSYAAQGNLDVVKVLLEAKADPNAGTLDLPLAMAAKNGWSEIAELLLRAGAKPDLASKTSEFAGEPGPSPSPGRRMFGGIGPFGPYTPLQIALSKSDTAMVKLLLKYKADANAKDPWSNPPRPMVGYVLGNPEMLQAFLEAGADANADSGGGWPLLVSACQQSNARAVELLLAHGAKTEAKGPEGRTPLSYAAEKNCLHCVELLLDAKADANATSPDGTTALHWAAGNASKEMAEALIAHGAEVNRKDVGGNTPLHWAVRNSGNGIGAEKMAELLLAKGADPNIRNNDGLTPLDLAKGKGRPQGLGRPLVALPPPGTPVRPQPSATEIASVLREHGALDDLPDFNSIRVTHAGWTPFVVFLKDTNSVNRFTLMEVILDFYGYPQGMRSGIPFPDFSKIIIHRPVGGKPGAKQEITVNLLTVTNSFDCAKDTWLKFGDVVEIPEREHTLAEPAVELTENQRTQLSHCLRGKVTFVVRGQKAELELDGTANTCRLQLALGRVQNLLRSSSDLSHIKIKRTDPVTGKTTEFIADSKLDQQGNVWLRDGDVIEVPDKP